MVKTSIIMTSYIPQKFIAEITMATIANITRYTNPDKYELILVDCSPKYEVRDDYQVLKIDKHLKIDPDPGYYEAMNIGAKEAQGDYLCFIENDIFVWEGWLEGLEYYLDRS